MIIGKITQEQILNPRIKASYNDIIRKDKCIVSKLETIESMRIDLINRYPIVSEMDCTILTGEVSDCFEKMYSCMEYVAIIFRELLREKGSVDSSFNKIIRKILKNKDSSSIYEDIRIKRFVENAIDWYAIVHDTRSEEAHFSMGKIEIANSNVSYKIGRQTGREIVYDLIQNIRGLPERGDSDYIINLEEIPKIYILFVRTIKDLETIIISGARAEGEHHL